MADNLAQLEARIRVLEARRAKGESVPELDVLYEQMDRLTRAGAETASKYPTGEMPTPSAPLRAPALPLARPTTPVEPTKLPGKPGNKKFGEGMTNYKKGGSVGSASKRADGCAQRGKTKGRMV